MATATEPQNPSTWAYGIKEPGWYCAMWGWRDWYAKHLESLGYKVVRSVKKPTEE